MATVKQYNLAGLNANVELGKQGSYIVGTANAINFYNANDELQKLSIANAVASNQAVTLAQLNSVAQDLVQHITVDVTHTSGTANIATIPAGSRILSVTVEIPAAWSAANNTGTFIEVGDTSSGSRFIRSQDADVLRADQYHSQYQYEYLTEGTLTYSVTAGGATAGSAIISVVLATDYALNTDTSAPAPTFAVAPSANTVNEGANITFTVTTTNFGSGTLYWATGGTASNADFVANSGTVSVTSNSGSFVISTAADLTTEGSETFFVQLRTDSGSGNIVATSSNVTISDTSVTPAPTFAVAPAANTVNENANITFTVTTTNFGSGTLYWTAEGSAVDGANAANVAADLTNSSGTVSVTSNSGSFVISTVADVTTEGSEAFFVRLRTDSISGNIVATSSNVIISDTSLTDPWEPSDITLALWLDANDAATITQSSGTVEQWNDKSGLGRNVSQTTAGLRPAYNGTGLNSRPTLTASSPSDKWLSTNTNTSGFSGGPNLWAITVCTMNTATDNSGRLLSMDQVGRTDFGNNDLSAILIRDGTQNRIQSYRQLSGTGPKSNVAVALDTPVIVSTIYDGVNNTTYVNGVAGTPVASGEGNFTTDPRLTVFAYLGGGSTAAGAEWNGSCSEIIVGDTALSSQNRERLEGYLAHKWGLTGGLPALHPYKTSPP